MEFALAGLPVHAATGGAPFDAARPVLAFMHGAGMDHTVWALQARYFAHHGHAVLAFDLPGHGRSAGPALGAIPDMADWLAQALAACGVAGAALVGHSMGALVAMELAAHCPERVRALALLGAAPAMPVHPDLLAAARDDPGLASRLIVSWAYADRAQIGGMRTPGLWMTGGGLSLLGRAGGGVLHADFAACNAYRGGPVAAAAIACPTLIVAGSQDRMTPLRGARALAQAIAGAEFRAIAECGHMMMVERPDQTLDALKDFFAQTAREAA